MATLLPYAWIVPVVFVIVFFALNVRLKPVCPHCGKESTDRIRRPLLVKQLLFFLPLVRFECWSCQKKYYVLGFSKNQKMKRNSSANHAVSLR